MNQTTVSSYTEVPGVFQDDEALKEWVAQQYGLTDWGAFCDVVSLSAAVGATVDVDPLLGEMYFDPELQTFLFQVEKEEEEEEEEIDDSQEDQEGYPRYETREVLRYRVGSFYRS